MLFRASLHKSAKQRFFLSLGAFSSISSTLTTIWESCNSNSPALALIRQCKAQIQAAQIHQQILTRGLMHQFSISLGSTYYALHAYSHALLLLQTSSPSPRLLYIWNFYIRLAVSRGELSRSLSLYLQMKKLGWSADEYTYTFVLKACGTSYGTGGSLHAKVVTSGYESNVFVSNALMAMYGRCGSLNDADKVFGEMCLRRNADLASWNSMVTCYIQCGDPKSAARLFDKMLKTGDLDLFPDVISFVNILHACVLLGIWKTGKEIHGFGLRSGLSENMFVANSLVDLYAKSGNMVDAEKVFYRMPQKDVVSWNSMVTGYSQIGRFSDAFALFEKMKEEEIDLDVLSWTAVIAGLSQRGLGEQALTTFKQMVSSSSLPNEVTLVSVLSGCASVGALRPGKEIHCYAMKNMKNPDDVQVTNALIDMYSKCKKLQVAATLFRSVAMDDRDVVTWTVMIGAYSQHGDASHALKLFSAMINKMAPNDHTISCALLACTRLGAIRSGREIHGFVTRRRQASVLYVVNCLIDMYLKSGDIVSARMAFDNMNVRNAVSWTSLITGYGIHGDGDEAMKLFREMQEAGFPPDGITFLAVLNACNHSGMIDDGVRYFNGMKESGVMPEEEHYACMVDLLGRAGRIEEAMEIIGEMPKKASAIIWATLLGSCRKYGYVERGEYAARQLMDLKYEDDGPLTLLSNMYANAGRWSDAARIRTMMRNSGVRKRPGCSWVEGESGFVSFFAGDRSHPLYDQISEVLVDLLRRIRMLGYVPVTAFALHDVDDEEKGELLAEHSEKLALAYGVLKATRGAPIRIYKNLRVCGDCHDAITHISRIVENEIVVRDSSRFHHFRSGVCSCGGYW